MQTFFIQTLGCRVNHYESEQIAALLMRHGLRPAASNEADVRVVHTCSVTMQAASQSRQAVRRLARLPLYVEATGRLGTRPDPEPSPAAIVEPLHSVPTDRTRPRVIVTGCWASSDPAEAASLAGVDAVIGHHRNIAAEIQALLLRWRAEDARVTPSNRARPKRKSTDLGVESLRLGIAPEGCITSDIEAKPTSSVNENPADRALEAGHAPRAMIESANVGRQSAAGMPMGAGATSLPLLEVRQSTRQRAYLKIQDGCDAHCTYCIIPKLRPGLWSKPLEDAVREAQALVDAGHKEIVLTGIFLGAFGQQTALRRRQPRPTGQALGELIEALCTRVAGLHRLRLSSLEPGDLSDNLLGVLAAHPQVMPHFHLPLQSGSDEILRRMNRQYTRDDFGRMIDRVRAAFDRPAITSDVVVAFPGESDEAFAQTADLVREAGLIHVHAFPYSPRPGTAAARWSGHFVRGPVVSQRIARLNEIAAENSEKFRASFVGEVVEVIVEREANNSADRVPGLRHGRCERHFSINFVDASARPGDAVHVCIDGADAASTLGHRVERAGAW